MSSVRWRLLSVDDTLISSSSKCLEHTPVLPVAFQFLRGIAYDHLFFKPSSHEYLNIANFSVSLREWYPELQLGTQHVCGIVNKVANVKYGTSKKFFRYEFHSYKKLF